MSRNAGYELCAGIKHCLQCPRMVASSRTPEGTPNRCPVCRKSIQIEPSEPFGDAPCPHCGCLLWFVTSASGTRYFSAEDAGQISKRLAEKLGIDEAALRDFQRSWQDLGADSLDMVELVMELENDFD
jgi:acyl carrier protein